MSQHGLYQMKFVIHTADFPEQLNLIVSKPEVQAYIFVSSDDLTSQKDGLSYNNIWFVYQEYI